VVALGTRGNSLLIWDAENKTVRLNLTNHTAPIVRLSLLSDGRLASGSNDSTIDLWHLETCSLDTTIQAFYPGMNGLDETTDLILTFASPKNVYFLNITDETIIGQLSGSGPVFSSLKALNDGLIALARLSGAIQIMIANNLTVVKTMLGHGASVVTMELLDNGLLVSGSLDKNVILWNYTQGRLVTYTNPLNVSITKIKLISNATVAIGGQSSHAQIVSFFSPTQQPQLIQDVYVPGSYVTDIAVLDENTLLFALDNSILTIYSILNVTFLTPIPITIPEGITCLQSLGNLTLNLNTPQCSPMPLGQLLSNILIFFDNSFRVFFIDIIIGFFSAPPQVLTSVYLGCFIDAASRDINALIYTDASLQTIETCLEYCYENNMSYAGLQLYIYVNRLRLL
jgi:WD40 repeat protein